jgi:hypothetical protein
LPLKNENATANEHGVLKLDVPLQGTRATPPLLWQRHYPHIDGFIEPWTRSGKLRKGLRFTTTGRGPCHIGSEQILLRSVVRCHSPAFVTFDPCFPRRRDRPRGDIAACANWPGQKTFVRWTITGRS